MTQHENAEVVDDHGKGDDLSTISQISELIGGIDSPEKPEDEETVEEESKADEGIEAEAEADTGDGEAEEAEKATSEEADDEWNLEYVAGEFDMAVEDLYDTPVPMPDGDGIEATTIGELKDFRIKHSRLQKQLEEKVQSLDKLDETVQAATLALTQNAPEAQAAKTRMEELSQQWDNTNWDIIPEGQREAHATQLRQAYGMAKVQHENATAAMSQYEGQIEAVRQTAEKARQEAWQQQAAQEWPKIQAENKWADEEAAEAGMKRYYKAMQDYGYSEEEARMATDHRVFKILKDAIDGRDAKSGVTKKRVKKVAKTVRGSKPIPKSVRQKRLQQRKLERAKAGDEAAKISLVSDLIS